MLLHCINAAALTWALDGTAGLMGRVGGQTHTPSKAGSRGPLLTLVSFGTTTTIICNYLKEEGAKAGCLAAVCISPALKLEPLANVRFLWWGWRGLV
jgi:hypothetical protein